MSHRILYVHSCSGLGGAPLSMLCLIEELDRKRFEPEVLFLGEAGAEVELYRQRGIRTHVHGGISVYPHARNAYLSLRSLRPWEIVTRALRLAPSVWRIRQFLRSHPVDVVHINTLSPLSAGIGAALQGVPVVWHVREPLHSGFLGLRRRLVCACVDRCSSAIIAISREDALPWAESPKVRVIYNPVNVDAFDRTTSGAAVRREIGVADDRLIVTMLGGVVHSKGADVFLEAAARVRLRRPNTLFVVAGYPPTGQESPSRVKRTLRRGLELCSLVPNIERRVIALMSRHSLGNDVRFVGMREDVPQLLAASTMLVWPATIPHFARPIIEAGAMARPVVASDFPVTREVVRPGETGLLFRPGDPAELATAIVRLLDHPEEARRMGEAGFAMARGCYDAAKSAEAIEAIYERILSGRETRS